MPSFQNIPLLKKSSPPELSTVTVLASKGLGRMWSFNINFFLLIGILTTFVLYLLFSFMLLIWHFGEYHQENVLEKLETDFQETQKALYQAKQRLKFLESYIDPSKIPSERPKKTANPPSPSPKADTTLDGNGTIQAESGVQESVVSIKELKVNRQGTSLSVNFKLARTSSDRSPIQGYIFIIAIDRSTDPPRLWSSPKAVFEKGAPIDPKKGQTYKIRNFRRIRARWSFASVENIPSELRILVYDRSGGLLLKENYRLEKDQNP